jgi:hypothetical protein
MTPERKLKLHDELHEARLKRRVALEFLAEAKAEYLARKESLRDATDVVEEILEEIETGITKRPMIDLMNGNGRHGTDLVTSRPDSTPATNGVDIEPERRRKKARASAG